MSDIMIMAAGVAALDALIVLLASALIVPAWRGRATTLVRRQALPMILVLSAISVLGTLYMEYGDALAPCLFCWWQRVFMYPILFIAALAMVKRRSAAEIADYVLVLAIPGFFIALYQHLLQMLPQGSLIPCDAANECAVRSVFEFGFVTLPWMALTVFAAIALVAFIARRRA
jgi:disulfide bond formation protein DsbB